MSRLGLIQPPFCIGFDAIERNLDRMAKAALGAYPPINVEEFSGGTIRITIAVAGFAPEQLSVFLKGNELTIKGDRTPSSSPKAFLHKGIASRAFTLSFFLAPGLVVENAQLTDGLLRIGLNRRPEPEQIQQIPITSE